MKKSILTIAVAFSMTTVFSQAPIIVWEDNLGGSNIDVATSIAATSDGGSIVGGYTNSDNGDVTDHISGFDAYITKYDASGTVEWKKSYGGSADDKCFSIIQDASGNYVFAGTTNSTNGDILSNSGAFDMWLMKLDASGNVLLSKTLGGSDDEAAYDLVQSTDGGYILVGDTKTDMIGSEINNGGYEGYVAKVSNLGTTLFQKLYGGSADESLKSVALLSTGEIVTAGETNSNDYEVSGNKGGYDFYFLRLRSNGTLRIAKTFGGTANDNAHGIAISGTSIFIAGETESNSGDVPDNNGGDDFLVLKVKTNGTLTFAKTFGGETSDIARSITRTSDGAMLIAGESESSSGDVAGNYGSDDYWVVKMSSNGVLQYQKNYGGADADVAYGITQANDGNFLVAGSSQSDDVDVSANNGNDDFWIIKLDNPEAKLSEQLSSVTISLYPNPATTVIYVDGSESMESVEIFTISGEKIYTAFVNDLTQTISVEDLTSGLYILKTTFANEIVVVKTFTKE